MKRKTPEEKQKEEAKIITRRSGTVYRHQREKAKNIGIMNFYTIHDFRQLVHEAIGKPCPYCESMVTAKNFSGDHATPISRGGKHEVENLVICCLACNQRKGILTDTEYMDLLGTINELPPDVAKNTLARLRSGGSFLNKWPTRKQHK